MASTYSPSLKLELIGNGDQSGTWGTTTNTNLGTLLEQAITGVQAITMVNADYTLSNLNGAADEARNAVLVVGGTNAAIRNVIAPAVEKLYVIRNNTVGGFAIVIKTSASTGVSIANGTTAFVYCDGSEFYLAVPPYASTNTASTLVFRDASGNFAAGTITANLTGNASTVTTNANLTGAVTSVGNATSLGSFTSANLAAALTDETGTGANVFANSPTLVTPALGTPSALVGTNITGTAAGLTAGNVTTNANLTGAVTSVGNATSLGSFTSANLAAALTDETGTGANVFANTPTLVTPILGTPTSGTLTNCTGLPISTGVSGLATGIAAFLATPSSANLAAALSDETGTGAAVFANSPTLVTPNLGTPSALVGTNISGTAASLSIGGNAATATNATNATTAATATNALACSGNSATVTNGVYTTNFTGANQSLSSNGYQKFPGGLIVQWGTSPVISGDSGVDITFPISFSAVYAITTAAIVSNDGRDAGTYTRNITTTGFRMTNGDGVAQAGMWIALGV